VPSSHVLDAQPMLAYLTNPDQPSIRQTNFTQIGANIHPTVPPPCVIQVGPAPTSVQLFTQQAICDEGGKWFGPNASNPSAPSFPSCCALKNAFPATYGENGSDPLGIVPDSQKAVRNDFYKMVQIDQPNCAAQPVNDVYPDVKLVELYQIDEAVPVPQLDKEGTALCADTLADGVYTQNCPGKLATQQQLTNFNALSSTLVAILKSEVSCAGDGNLDKVVNQQDINNWTLFSQNTLSTSSWYDFAHDGTTGNSDLQIIQANLGKRCVPKR